VGERFAGEGIPPPTPASGGQCGAFAEDMGIYSGK